jgi:hypothetical protein
MYADNNATGFSRHFVRKTSRHVEDIAEAFSPWSIFFSEVDLTGLSA